MKRILFLAGLLVAPLAFAATGPAQWLSGHHGFLSHDRWLHPLQRLHRAMPYAPDATALHRAAATFGRAYGGPGKDYAYLVRLNSDGSFVIGGETDSFGAGGHDLWLARLDSSGTITWQKTYGTAGEEAGDITPTPDGGYLLAARDFDHNAAWLAKLDANGTIQWQKQLNPNTAGYAVAQLLSDGGFLLSGNAINMSTFSLTFRLMRLTSSGSVVWQKEYPSSRSLIGMPLELSDGSFLVAGTSADMSTNNTDVWLMKLSSTGQIQWQKTYGGSGNDSGGLVTPISGGYLLAAQTNSFGPGAGTDTSNIWLLKLDTSGNILWQKVLGGTGDEFAFPTAQLADGWILGGVTDSFGAGNDDAFLAKLDTNGNVQWAKSYGGANDDMLVAFADSAGGYLAAGMTQSFGGGGEDAWVVKFDSNFNIVWQRAYGGSADDSGAPERRTDGSILFCGDTSSFGSGDVDAWVLSLDANGQIPSGCQPIRNTSVSGVAFSFTTATTAATVGDPAATAADTTFTLTAGAVSSSTAGAVASDVCTASQTLRASASASPTSGAAPLTVTFTGSASGGQPPYSYAWNFGDGSAIDTRQNPTHTYTSAGSYAVTLTVTDAASATAQDTHLTITVSSAGGCTVTCQASVPTTGSVGTAITFTATATTSGCTVSPVYVWTFGDTSGATGQTVSHTYSTAGTYTWNLLVQVGTVTCTKSGTITIGSGTEGVVSFVPSLAHAPGANSTQWRTDVAAVNRSALPAALTLLFTSYDGSQTITRNTTLPSGATVEWRDILVSLFGVSASASTKGTLKVTSTTPVALTSRTYNQAAAGTYGQYYPAVSTTTALAAGQVGIIPQIKKTTAFRTNLGALNPGTAQITVAVKLFAASGNQVGSKTLTVPAGRWIQQDDIFGSSGAGNQDLAYATVEVETQGGRAWCYASVIDGTTGDPTTIPVQPVTPALVNYIPSLAHAPGASGTQWRTDVAAVNRSALPAALTLLFTSYDGSQTITRNATLPSGATVEWRDILVSLFGVSASASTKGTLKVTSTTPVALTSRTYNQAAAGTYGQYYPAVSTTTALAAGQVGIIPQIKKTTAFRTNLGALNPGTAQITVAVKLFAASGNQVGSKTLTVPAGRWIQQDDIFGSSGAGNQDLAYATVEVETEGGRAWCYASVIDGTTGDPTTIPVLTP
jgi:PKD repeat protein